MESSSPAWPPQATCAVVTTARSERSLHRTLGISRLAEIGVQVDRPRCTFTGSPALTWSTTTPSRYTTLWWRRVGTRAPPSTVPVMLSGSAPATTTSFALGTPRRSAEHASTALGQRVLLAGQPGHEPPAEATPRASRRRRARTTSRHGTVKDSRSPQLPGHHAPAGQELLGHRLGQLLVAGGGAPSRPPVGPPSTSGPGQQRPPSLTDAGARRARRARRRADSRRAGAADGPGPPPVAGREQGPHGRERVGGHEAPRHQVPQPLVDLGREPARERRQLRSEAGAPRRGERRARRRRRRPRAREPPRRPARRAAAVSRSSRSTKASGVDGRRARRPRPPGSALRGEPPPGHLAREAELVEPAGVVAGHPGREDLRLPLGRRRPRSPGAAR